MTKNTLVAALIAATLVMTAAQPTAAQTLDEWNTQVQALKARIAELTKQLEGLLARQPLWRTFDDASVAPPSSGTADRHRVCKVLLRNLGRGDRGDDVHGLQEFLREEGVLSAEATGFYGDMTVDAVARWQDREGITRAGAFGPISRERLMKWCRGVGWTNRERFSAEPQRGQAPLTVTFYSYVSGFRPQSDYYTIDFGDGTSERASHCPAPADACTGPGTNTHTYSSNGTYTATLTHTSDPCGGNPQCLAPISYEVVGKVQIHVGTAPSCTKEYRPVCASKPIVCITTPCDPIRQTYSNRCMAEADGATFVHEGQCQNDPVACTLEYNPVCGQSPEPACRHTPPYCMLPTPGPQTYSNKCFLRAAGATFLYEGECKNDIACPAVAYPRPTCAEGEEVVPVNPGSPCPGPWKCSPKDPANDPRCKAWYDGCNSCSRETPSGPAMCTLRACMAETMTKPYCTAWFDSSNKPPVISGFSGPTTLRVNETGTWNVNAWDPESGNLSYRVRWGDENIYAANLSAAPASEAFVQSTSFTHVYAHAGTYTITIMVRDSAGKEAKTTTTVKVTGGSIACTEEYAPVCGRPQGCANTCPPGAYCTMVCQLHQPQTYSNRCRMNEANAELLHTGVCTASSGQVTSVNDQ